MNADHGPRDGAVHGEGEGVDPLAALLAAWNAVEAPAPADALVDADDDTRQVVAWMQAGWAAIETPAPVVPDRPAARRGLRLRLLEGTGRSLAAAALLLVMLGAPLLLTGTDTPDIDGTGPGPLAGLDTDTGAGTGDGTGTGGPTHPAAGLTTRPHPQVVALADPLPGSDAPVPTGLELRSGSVRLLLVGTATAGL